MARPIFMHIFRQGSADNWVIHVRNINKQPMPPPEGMAYQGYLGAQSYDDRTDNFIKKFLSQMANTSKFPFVPKQRLDEVYQSLVSKVPPEAIHAMSWTKIATEDGIGGQQGEDEDNIPEEITKEYNIVLKNLNTAMKNANEMNQGNIKNFESQLKSIPDKLSNGEMTIEDVKSKLNNINDIIQKIGGNRQVESFKDYTPLLKIENVKPTTIINKSKDIIPFNMFLEGTAGEGKGFLTLFQTVPGNNFIQMGLYDKFLNFITAGEQENSFHHAYSLFIGGNSNITEIQALIKKTTEKGIQVLVSADDDIGNEYLPPDGAGYSGYFRGEEPKQDEETGVYSQVQKDIKDTFGQRNVKAAESFVDFCNTKNIV